MRRIQLLTFIIILAVFITACVLDPVPPRQLDVAGLTLDKTSLVLNLWTDDDYDRSTAVLKVNILPALLSQDAVWGSSNPLVAIVEDGIVTALTTGTAYITAIRDGFMATCSVVVLDQEPGAVENINIQGSITLYLGGTNRQSLTPIFTPVFVNNEGVTWSSSDNSVAVVSNGVVTAVGAGTTVITVKTNEGAFTDTCEVTVIPLIAQFKSILDFLTAGNTYYKPGFDFGTPPDAVQNVKAADTGANVSLWTGTNTNQPDFVIQYTYDTTLFGSAGAANLVPRFVHPKIGDDFAPARLIPTGPYRSHTQFNDASIAHYAFTGFRQAHPWGIHSITDPPSTGAGTTRAGQTWSVGFNAYTANINTVQFSGIGVDLGSDIYIDTVLIYAGGNVTSESAFNSGDIDVRCPGITLEYMPSTAANASFVFDALYKANLHNWTTDDWNIPGIDNNWPAPRNPEDSNYPASPWISAGKIVPNGSSWVFVFHLEQPVFARFLRINFEQAPVEAPATGFLGRAFVNSFEVYNTKAQ